MNERRRSEEYAVLESEHRVQKPVVDHREAWNALTPLATVNGTARDRVAHFADSRRISFDALIALGTRIKVDANGGVELAWGHRAHLDGREIISGLKFRPLGEKKRYAAPPSTFVEPIVIGDRGALDWFVAEGETDAARLYDLVGDVAAVLLLPAGALTFKPAWARFIPRGPVYLCHDADEKGDAGADKAAALIGGKTVRVRPPDEETDWCDWAGGRDEFVSLVRSLRGARDERPFALPLDEFIALERPKVEPLIVDTDGRPLIARNSFTLAGGLGGSGKTTLFCELAMHLAAGVDYLCFRIPKPVSVLLIENEGPEDLFADKLEQKLATFPHQLKARLAVSTFDWGAFTLGDPEHLQRLCDELAEHQYDLVFGDPLDSLGIEGVGSPEDTRKFFGLLKDTGLHRTVAWWLNTHPRKEETKEALNEITGSWGGKPDAVLLLRILADDRTQVRFPKLRWAKKGRRPAILLGFDADTETFTFLGEETDEEERDYLVEIAALLADGKGRTVKEISVKREKGGIGANDSTVRKTLETHPDRFVSVTGDEAKAVGRSPSATLWNLTEKVHPPANAPDASDAPAGEGEGTATCFPHIGEAVVAEHLTPGSKGALHPDAPTLDEWAADPGSELVPDELLEQLAVDEAARVAEELGLA